MTLKLTRFHGTGSTWKDAKPPKNVWFRSHLGVTDAVSYGLNVSFENSLDKKNWFCTYDGGWDMGERHGQGIYYFQDGSRWTGTWHEGKSVGEGTLEYSDGRKQTGAWKDFKAKKKKHSSSSESSSDS